MASYPFDWIISNLNIVQQCLENKFTDFLDKQYYIDIDDTKCGHSLYDKYMFYHRNPLRHSKDYDYYKNCITRFNELLNKTENKLFMVSFLAKNNNIASIKEEIIQFNEIFKKHTTNYILLCVIHFSNQDGHSFHFSADENIHYLEIYNISISNGLHYDNEIDVMYTDNVIKSRYTFELNKIMPDIPPPKPIPKKQIKINRFMM